MTRVQARRRRRRRQAIQRVAAWTVMITIELIVAAVPAVGTAALLVPYANAWRGCTAVGSEWLAVAIVFCLTFKLVHNWICNRIFEET